MATSRNEREQIFEPNDKQLVAIDALVSGKNDREAAGVANVHRCTVTKWRLYNNPSFRAALNKWAA